MAARLDVRQGRPEDDAAALALRNAVFPPISPEDWAGSPIAAVARLDDRLVGVIPFVVRPFVLAPGVVVRAAFANSVAVAEDVRGMGIGSRMMAAARQFLPAHVEAMCVYTADEAAGPQYRFYHRSGHHDLLYPRLMTASLSESAAPLPQGAVIVSSDELVTHEADLLDLYAACYGDWGGSPARGAGSWHQALASHIFVEVPYDAFELVLVRGSDRLSAYALVGTREQGTVVLEAAARDETSADTLWPAVAALAGSRHSRQITIHGQGFGSPLHASLIRAGFSVSPRDDVLAGQVIAPEPVYEASLSAAAGPAPPAVEVWTPERTLSLGTGAVGLRLEMKEDDLHLLLLHRLDLESAVRQQRVTVRSGGWDQIQGVAGVLSFAPWVYHHLDYI